MSESVRTSERVTVLLPKFSKLGIKCDKNNEISQNVGNLDFFLKKRRCFFENFKKKLEIGNREKIAA